MRKIFPEKFGNVRIIPYLCARKNAKKSIAPWCNGSTPDFGSVWLSSSLGGATIRNSPMRVAAFFVPIAIRQTKLGYKKSRLVLTDKPTALHLWRLKMEGLHIPGTVNVKLMTLTAHSPDCDCRRKDSDFSPILQKNYWKKRYFQSIIFKNKPPVKVHLLIISFELIK